MEDVTIFHKLRHPQVKLKHCPTTFSQLLGAEFCAALSRRMSMMATDLMQGKYPTTAYSPMDNELPSSDLEMNQSQKATVTLPVPSFQLEVLQDLSAHYGSSALRRGNSKILGIPGRSIQAAQRGHHRSYNRVWQIKRAHTLFCRHCGVWLDGSTRQTVEVPNSAENKEGSSSTKGTSSSSLSHSNPLPCLQRWTCCVRCLTKRGVLTSRLKGKRVTSKKATVKKISMVNLVALQNCRVKRRRRKRKTGKQSSGAPVKILSIEEARQTALHRVIPKGPLNRGQRKQQLTSKVQDNNASPHSPTIVNSPYGNSSTGSVTKNKDELKLSHPGSPVGTKIAKAVDAQTVPSVLAIPKPKKKTPAPVVKGKTKTNPTSPTNDLLKNLGL